MTCSAVIPCCVFQLTKKLLLCCSAPWVSTSLIQTRTSSAPLYVRLMYLAGFRSDILNAAWVSVYTYSSCGVICGLFQRGCSFTAAHLSWYVSALYNLSNSTCCQIKPAAGKILGDGALCWNHHHFKKLISVQNYNWDLRPFSFWLVKIEVN